MIKRVHFLGIGGSGSSAAAAIAQAQGFEISGCDLEPDNEFSVHTGSVKLFKGHSASHLSNGNVDMLAVTPAIFSLDPDNPELSAAKKMGIPVMTWQQFVGEYLTKDKFVIAVCGTHGKTTTTAMIAQILEDAGLDPTVLLGAIHLKWKANFRVGKGKYFVVEADEFNDNFLHLKPDINVVTNIEMDHPEYFKDLESVKDSFKKFLLQTKDTIVANLNDLNVAEVIKNVYCLDYSKNHLNTDLKIPGQFNRLNAMAALQAGLLLGIAPQIIQKSLMGYSGVGRRFEYLGDYRSVKVYSDFGHHPTEIKVTMEAARQKFPNERIWLIYEPHMFSRTKALFDDFVKVFKDIPVDKIIITDIYPSREVDTGLITSQQLVDAINDDKLVYVSAEGRKGSSVYQTKKNLINYLRGAIQQKDIFFFMGAGEIDKIAKELLS